MQNCVSHWAFCRRGMVCFVLSDCLITEQEVKCSSVRERYGLKFSIISFTYAFVHSFSTKKLVFTLALNKSIRYVKNIGNFSISDSFSLWKQPSVAFTDLKNSARSIWALYTIHNWVFICSLLWIATKIQFQRNPSISLISRPPTFLEKFPF